MRIVPFRKPRMGLSFTGHSLGLTEVRRHMGTCAFLRHKEIPLSPEALKPSPLAANITNGDELREHLQALGMTPSRPNSVALCLPDICARLAVFELTALPASPREQEALIGWRFQQDLNIATANARIGYRVFRQSRSTSPGTDSHPPPIFILAVAIQKDIVESYEDLCLSAGCIPMSMSLAGLSVFHLCRSAMETSLAAQSTTSPGSHPAIFFLFLADWGFSLIVLHEGQPKFLRTKPLVFPRPVSDAPGSMPGHEELPPTELPTQVSESVGPVEQDSSTTLEASATVPPNSPPIVDRVAHELIASIHYYFDSLPLETRDQCSHLHPLFLVGGANPEQTLPQIGHQVEQAFSTTPYSLQAIPLHSGTPGLTGPSFSWLHNCPGPALASFAATVTA